MKTAISVEDELLEQTDHAAREMGVSRSKLVSLALGAFLRERRQQMILDQLNRAYDGQPDPMAAKIKEKFRAVIEDKW